MLRGIDEEQMLYIKIVKGLDAKRRPFTAYVLLTEEQKDNLQEQKDRPQNNVKYSLNTYEIFYKKLGDVTESLHNEIMIFFALRYLDRPLRYIVNDMPLDKEFFTEEDFVERRPILITSFKAKYLKTIPEKLHLNSVNVEEENTTYRGPGR